MKLFFSILAVSLLLLACTKTEKIVEMRQADPDVKASFSQVNRKTLTIQKSALEKAFLLIANSKTTGLQPAWKEHPIKIVSFEKAGAKVGLFEIGYLQIYKSLNAQKLMQSFEIVSETETTVVIDVEKGFGIIGLDQGFEVMRPDKNLQDFKSAGIEVRGEVVDTLVKNSEIVDNRLLISQASRLKTIANFSVTNRSERADVKTQEVREVGMSLDSRIELIPYQETQGFKAKEQDKDWAIGSFLTRILQENSQEYQSIALRWSATEATPIRYILTANTPKEIIPVIKEGLEYWNRVAGKKLIQVEISDQMDLPPTDHAVIVRWIPYKDAGMAYAGMQSNPVTGEILRGHIYLPSFWTNQESMKSGYGETGLAGLSACGIQVSLTKELENLAEKVPATKLQQAMLDYLRMVVAHEAGHTLGMRHNFGAAASIPSSYEELVKTQKDYLVDAATAEKAPILSTSVMDYTSALDSSIIGRSLLAQILPYDKDFIAWSYLGEEKPATPVGSFCTDDHLMYASEEKVTVFGCGPFKPAGRPLTAALVKQNAYDESAIQEDANELLKAMIGPDGTFTSSFVNVSSKGVYRIQSSPFSGDLTNYMFVARGNKTYLEESPLQTRKAVTKALVDGYSSLGQTSDSALTEPLEAELKELLASPQGRKALLPVDEQGHINLAWNDEIIQELSAKYKAGKTANGVSYQMSDEELATFVTALKEVTKPVLKMKLLMAAKRLLIRKEAVTENLKDKDVTIAYREWLGAEKIKALLKPYVLELLIVSAGTRSITNPKGSVLVPDYVMNEYELKALHGLLKESFVMLGMTLEERQSVVNHRLGAVKETLVGLGIEWDLNKSFDEQITILTDLAGNKGVISTELFSWAKSEIEFARFVQFEGPYFF